MRTVSIGGRRTLVTIVTTAVVAGMLAVTGVNSIAGATETTDPASDDTLGAHDEKLLSEAEANGEATVTILVATDDGQNSAVADGLKSLGAQISNKVDQVNYIRANVPTAKVHQAAKLPGVSAIDLNESVPLPDPAEGFFNGGFHPGVPAGTPPGPGTAADNPYLPTGEVGSVLFKKLHPTWDGRGITIGILDSGVDLDNPWLQTTSTGERKITDWFTATDPLFDGDRTWRVMVTEVIATAPGNTFAAPGGVWTAPAPGTYRFNRFAENITLGDEPGGDVNRDGDTNDLFGILYNKDTNDIWVDSDQDLNFANNPLMRPYKEKFDIGHFGTDNPTTPVRDQMPFVVEFREDVDTTLGGLPGLNDFVNIGIIEAQHGSHVAGITAAHDILGNPNFDGAAPGAKIVSGRACSWGGGCTFAALTDGMIDLVVNRHVDVVNMSIGGLPALNDGANARAELYNTLIRDEGVQLFISAGNSGPGVNTIGDPSVATDVVSVGATVSKNTWLANYGSQVTTVNGMFNFSSRGPREDGGFKPNITAPGSAISTTPLWQPGAPVVPEAGYDLPPGLSMLNGTSMASPQAAGGAALLLSAAKATGKSATPAELRRAIYASANYNNGVAAVAQGNGELDVNGAWLLLALGVSPRNYTVDAPVCTAISQFLVTPHRGTGIYNSCPANAGGQTVNKQETYKVNITRTSGPAYAVLHRIKWVGNDGTFNAPDFVALPLNHTVQVNVKAKPQTAGSHSAVMQVDDLTTLGNDFEIMTAINVSTDLVGPAYTFSTTGSVQRNAYKSYFITVPPGTPALQVNLSGIAADSQTRWIAFTPFGVPAESTSSLVCYTNRPLNNCDPTSRFYANPLPGVWELEVESRRTSPHLDNPFTLTAVLQGVSVNPAVTELASVPLNVAQSLSWSLTNILAPVTVKGTGGSLGSAARGEKSIADQAHQFFTVVVPPGATSLTATIGNPSDQASDLDLFLRLGGQAGQVIAQSADGDSEESVTVTPNPLGATYTVEIHGFDVPNGTTTYDYLDVFFSPSLGSLTVDGTAVSLGIGGTGTLNGTITAGLAPAAGRQLFGDMVVRTTAGAVVGRGSVVILAATP